MTFSVNSRALAGLPMFLDRRATDLSTATTYVADNTSIQPFTLMNLWHTHQRVLATIGWYLVETRLAYPQNDAERIRAAIESYAHSDLRAAQRADAAIAGLPRDLPNVPAMTPTERSYGPAIFDDRLTPTIALIPPSSHLDDFPYQASWSDLLSPTSLVRDAIWRATSVAADLGLLDRPIDVVQDVVPPFIGDWPGLLRCADVFDSLGAMLGMSQDAVDDVAQLVPTVWTGNVAGMCGRNLGYFAADLGQAIPPLAGLADTYRQVAKGVRANIVLATTIITALSDLAIDFVLGLASAGLYTIFSVGSNVRNIVHLVKKLLEIANAVADAASAGAAMASGYLNRFGVLRTVGPLPTFNAAGLLPTGAIPILR